MLFLCLFNFFAAPENVKIMDEFNHLVNKVEEMRKQRQFLENQLRDALMKDDITKRLVTLNKKDDVQVFFFWCKYVRYNIYIFLSKYVRVLKINCLFF